MPDAPLQPDTEAREALMDSLAEVIHGVSESEDCHNALATALDPYNYPALVQLLDWEELLKAGVEAGKLERFSVWVNRGTRYPTTIVAYRLVPTEEAP